MLLANILITFPIKYDPVFSNGPKNPPKNPPDCPILRNYIYIYILYIYIYIYIYCIKKHIFNWKCVFLFNIYSNTSCFWLFNFCIYIYIYMLFKHKRVSKILTNY